MDFFDLQALITDNNLKLLNSIEDIVIISNKNGDILSSNDSAKTVLGYSKKNLLKNNIQQIFMPKISLNNIKNNYKHRLKHKIITKENSYINVETTYWSETLGDLDLIFLISRDISRENEALEKFKVLFENNPAIMVISDCHTGKLLEINRSFSINLGFSEEEVIGKTSLELGIFKKQETRDKLKQDINRIGKLSDIELQLIRKDGSLFYGILSSEIIKSRDQEFYLTVITDISEQKRLQKIVESKRQRLTNIIEGTRLGTWEWNIQTGETIFNSRWAEIIGYTLEELKPISIDTWEKFAFKDDLMESERLLNEHFEGKTDYYEFESRMHHKDGTLIWVLDRGKVIEWDNNGKPLMMFGTHSNITKRKELENSLKELATRDPLTNIFNRRYVFERLETSLEQYRRDKTMLSISIIDIDHFKKINDTYGHQCGDYILKEFTKLLNNSLRPYDILGRYGGEEFIIILNNSNKDIAKDKIKLILKEIQTKIFVYEQNKISLTFSCGISDTSELTKITVIELVNIADSKLYKAKSSGRNRVEA